MPDGEYGEDAPEEGYHDLDDDNDDDDDDDGDDWWSTMMIHLPQNGWHLKHQIRCENPQSDHNGHLRWLVCMVSGLQTEMMKNIIKTRSIPRSKFHNSTIKHLTTLMMLTWMMTMTTMMAMMTMVMLMMTVSTCAWGQWEGRRRGKQEEGGEGGKATQSRTPIGRSPTCHHDKAFKEETRTSWDVGMFRHNIKHN